MDLSGGARVNDEVWYIAVIHAKEAKYMLKRPVVRKETRLRLTKDDTDLMGNYLSHTGALLLNRRSHFVG
jgi:hypothetical protein